MKYPMDKFPSQLSTTPSLKGLQNCILRIIRVWLLFCSIRIYNPAIFTYSFGELVFLFSVFSVFSV